MVSRVLVIGGYGNFGGHIARSLAGDAAIRLLIGGRSLARAQAYATPLGGEGFALDIHGDIAARLRAIRPDIVIHATGPFQGQDYRVARAAIGCGAHYLDLADARDFVAGIGALDADARAAGVAAVAGASSVPCLTAAIIDAYRPQFAHLRSICCGISAGEQGARGLATAAAVLGYAGKPFLAWKRGAPARVFGWQGLHAVRYPELGLGLFGNCDVPDLALFPARYPGLDELRFAAGHQIKLLHLGTWAMSWAVRLGLVRNLAPHAGKLLGLGRAFDRLGTGRSGLHMILTGTGPDGNPHEVRFFLIARSGDGPNIPCVPAILLARRLARGGAVAPGARPCLDLVTLPEFLEALNGLDVSTFADGPAIGPVPALAG